MGGPEKSEKSDKQSVPRQCVVCRWEDVPSKGPLIKPCDCAKDKGLYHYKCVSDLIMSTFDAPCRGCDHRFIDSRIQRCPPKYLKFVTTSLPTQCLLVLWAIMFAITGYMIRREPKTSVKSCFVAVVVILSVLIALMIYFLHKSWLKGQDSCIWFHEWNGKKTIGEFNVTQSKKTDRKVWAMV